MEIYVDIYLYIYINNTLLKPIKIKDLRSFRRLDGLGFEKNSKTPFNLLFFYIKIYI